MVLLDPAVRHPVCVDHLAQLRLAYAPQVHVALQQFQPHLPPRLADHDLQFEGRHRIGVAVGQIPDQRLEQPGGDWQAILIVSAGSGSGYVQDHQAEALGDIGNITIVDSADCTDATGNPITYIPANTSLACFSPTPGGR